MSQELYTDTVLECSKLITNRYSTSFSFGIRSLAKKYHPAIYAIYGFVRLADEIVDTFHNHNKAVLLARFREDTYLAIEEGVSFNPVLHAFQWAVNTYKIERELIEAFLVSMAMDLELESCDRATYDTYIYGSAEVVGLMCLRVFCEGNEGQYAGLKEQGRRLGAAFQKVNFLRDLQSDYKERGRVYFPDADFNSFDAKTKKLIEAEIKEDFVEALEGIKNLPKGSKAGVYLAYTYYVSLFNRIKKSEPERILNERVRVPDFEKMWLMCVSYARLRFNAI
jgi:phytoene/squalene synthetase